jgi:hypothetical protein
MKDVTAAITVESIRMYMLAPLDIGTPPVELFVQYSFHITKAYKRLYIVIEFAGGDKSVPGNDPVRRLSHASKR